MGGFRSFLAWWMGGASAPPSGPSAPTIEEWNETPIANVAEWNGIALNTLSHINELEVPDP